MAKKPLEIRKEFGSDSISEHVSFTWDRYNRNRDTKIKEWQELRNYIFATDTQTTSNKSLPWKNSTTLPKLCQIRDNLHSNYISALFPNDDWLKWEAYSQDAANKTKVTAIEAYMGNKTRVGGFRTEISKILYDYIDYGNAFATCDYESSYILNDANEKVVDFIGPKIRRISPMDIVFNPLASSFKDSFKIVRSLRNIGELILMAQNEPDNAYLQNVLAQRKRMFEHCGKFGVEDFQKAEGLLVDGFGNYYDYLQSGYVEFLEFYGDIHNQDTGAVETGRHVVVVDRMYVIKNEPIPSWAGSAPIWHVGWRTRPDNLWAMGPLDNLVGMQYRIDHLENLKADAMDLGVMPPLVISGDVEEFEYGPGSEIHIDENGSVTELGKNIQWVLSAETAIDRLEQRMEMYAGAPREAMGIRTPGEKTMFEVQQLQNAAGRIFQEKTTTFEIELLEKALNGMLEISRRNFDQEDVSKVMDNDLGVQKFVKITKDGITASGKLRPIGARHFATQAQLLQNLSMVFNGPMKDIIMPHTSSVALAQLLEDVIGLNRYQLFKPNAAVFEQQETQRLVTQAGENLQAEDAIPDVVA